MDALLVDINQAGLGRGLQFELFRPAAAEITREFYAELPIQVKVTGTYHDMGAFASDVGQLSRIVTLNDVVDPGRQGRHPDHGRHRAHLPLPRRRGSLGAAQGRVEEGRQEMMRLDARSLALLAAALLLAACGGEEYSDLKAGARTRRPRTSAAASSRCRR